MAKSNILLNIANLQNQYFHNAQAPINLLQISLKISHRDYNVTKSLHIISEKVWNDNGLFIVSSLEKGKPEMYFLENISLNFRNKTKQIQRISIIIQNIYSRNLKHFAKWNAKLHVVYFTTKMHILKINVVNKLSVTTTKMVFHALSQVWAYIDACSWMSHEITH